MKDIIKVFDIVASPYRDLTGKLKTNPDGSIQAGLFLVLRIDKGNLVCAKVTSQMSSFINEYTYTLQKSSHIFLHTTSYVQLDRINTLSIHTVNKVGEVSVYCREGLKEKLSSLFNSILSSIGYSSPNVVSSKYNYVEGDDYETELQSVYKKGYSIYGRKNY